MCHTALLVHHIYSYCGFLHAAQLTMHIKINFFQNFVQVLDILYDEDNDVMFQQIRNEVC